MSLRSDTIHRMTNAVLHTAMVKYLMMGEFKTEGTYRRQLWRTMRELFNQEIDEFEFIDDMVVFIDNQFTRAWNQGAKEMGVYPNQFKDEDYDELARLIEQERGYMLRLADDILHARVQVPPNLNQFRVRADMWANRYNEIVGHAHIWFGGKMALEWVFGDTDHCDDCARLNGVVATADDWKASKWRPQGRDLECGGWRCRCRMVPTTKPLTEGGIPI